jgi:homoserine O-acetyltransferase
MSRMARLILALLLAYPSIAAAQTNFPAPIERDFIVRNFTFASGETLPEVRIHYRTIGEPRKDADGVVRNGILILHGTGGTGASFLGAGWAGRLYGKGQLYDAERYFIILPDNIGHGRSSKPSDGLRMKFPRTATPTWCGCSIGSSPRVLVSHVCMS